LSDPRPSPDALRRLRRLLARRNEKAQVLREIDDELALAVLEVREAERVTVRALAEALGVGRSTVQDWTRRGRQLRDHENER
jgi:DNA-binding transcriptional regulator YiaG